MKNKELKAFWKLAKKFWIAGFVLWAIETSFFLIYEGWHLKATNPIEIFLDKTSSSMCNFALWLTIITCCFYLINLNKRKP